MVCTPCSLSHDGAMGLRAQAGQTRTLAVGEEAGFSASKRAFETSFNLIYQLAK
ncbi:MAG: hypothetical protein ACI8TP_000869 [Acidimicrobiales bacterium]|jgi:hypothetical protein